MMLDLLEACLVGNWDCYQVDCDDGLIGTLHIRTRGRRTTVSAGAGAAVRPYGGEYMEETREVFVGDGEMASNMLSTA